jgi:hypothetical protein
MYLLLVFLLVTFVIGGTTLASHDLRKPLSVLLGCVIVGIMFYSRQVL